MDIPFGYEKYGKMPHFDKLLGVYDVEEYLQNETFHLYKFKSGKRAGFLRVSESGRWFSLLGGYLPVDLIVGYNKQKCNLYTIDGAIIRLPFAAMSFPIRRELEEFFEERGSYYKEKPENAWSTYSVLEITKKLSLPNEDWGKLRYLWEKSLMNNNERKKKAGAQVYNTEIFERVLSDIEIRKLVANIVNKKTDMSDFLDFYNYRNEYSVCNGIDLLRMLDSPRNIVGVDFLFDCLSAVDEPYFAMAVELLKTFPKKIREQKIEECAKATHESGNVEKFGGLLYLAKELGYEIKYVQEMKVNNNKEI